MRILEDAVIQDRYDVIVVGAGLGGMTAAGLLAKRGLSTLIIDQQGKPGGSCTSFKREDVVFDVGTAMLYGFGETGFRPFRFLINELEEEIEVVAHPTLARMWYEGHEIVFWPDVDRFLDELGRLFPAEKETLRAFYADLYKMYEHIVLVDEVIVPPSEFSPRQGLRRLLKDPVGVVKMRKLLTTSTRELLERYFHTPEIFQFYDKICSAYCYCTTEETPAVLAATMFLDNHIGGVYTPAGGAQMLPNTIEKAFERYGGQVLYRHLVDEILIREGTPVGRRSPAGRRAHGVRLADGTEIAADRVVANATVWNLYGRLVRPEHIPPERLAWAQALVPTYPSMLLYMVMDREALPEDALPWESFIENTEEIDSTDLTLYVNALVDHTLCAPDELVIMAIAPNMCPWPGPDDPDYRSPQYQAQKKREADKMLDQIERHYPGFREHIRTLIVGTPTTIERYLLKNGGAVGGPKNALGQEMLNRLHARSEWENLYVCGDSTVMATGAPATVVSGVGAANMVLRDLRLKEYDTRAFPRQYVRYVDLPYQRPRYRAGDPISASNAHLAAAQCQGCEKPACMRGCPAGVDIPGFLRRMEARNTLGAARLLRERNPLAEVCGHVCAADELCQRHCYRKSFADAPVPIAAMERWVCQEAGQAGWLRAEPARHDEPVARDKPVADGPQIAVVGAGPSGLSCTYYCALMGCQVDLYDRGERPGGALWQRVESRELPRLVLERDLQGILSERVHFHGGRELGATLDIEKLLRSYDAVYLARGSGEGVPSDLASTLGQDGGRQVGARPGLYASGGWLQEGQTVVEAVADGRRTAVAIGQDLRAKG